MSEKAAIGRGGPVTVESLTRDLHALGVEPGMTLIVHSAMSAMGWVCGGAQAAIEALTATLGPDGTLAMPAFSTGLTDPADWEHPPVPESWWQLIRDSMPAFDKRVTPTRKMGAIAELFRTLPDVLRSDHPTESVAARGPRAPFLTDGHELTSPSGERSPLARLYDLDAFVLLLGVGHGSNSSMHLAEDRADWPGKKVVARGVPLSVDGRREWVVYEALDSDSGDFELAGASFAAQTTGTVGSAKALLFGQRDVVDHAVDWFERNRSQVRS